MTTDVSYGKLAEALDRDGCVILAGVFDRAGVERLIDEATHALANQTAQDGSIRQGDEPVTAARNLLQVWPRLLDAARTSALCDFIVAALGADCALVRGLYFDKPPGRSWALPWHKDLTIAVGSHDLPSAVFNRRTTKAGVPHVEAPEHVLEGMVTARIHLDDVTLENGPLLVVPGSHRLGKNLVAPAADAGIRPIQAAAGDVLLMRPLLTHSSGYAQADTRRRRRVVHLEFASGAPLPDGYAWHDFWRLEREG